jgi:hypothetical protein
MRVFGRGIGRLKAWLRAQVPLVPPAIDACEFECRETWCPPERMDGCPRRLRRAARQHGHAESADKITPATAGSVAERDRVASDAPFAAEKRAL